MNANLKSKIIYIVENNNTYDLDAIFKTINVTDVDNLTKVLYDFFKENISDIGYDKDFLMKYTYFLYDLVRVMANDEDNLVIYCGFINRNMRMLKEELKPYNKNEIPKDKKYHVLNEYLSRLKGISETIRDMFDKNMDSKDFKTVWYIVSELKNVDYLFSIFEKDKELINLRDSDGEHIFYKLCDSFYANVSDMDQYSIEYYKRAITLFLENPNLELRNDEFAKLLKITKKNLLRSNTKEREHINFVLDELDRHYPVYHSSYLKTAVNYACSECPTDISEEVSEEDKDRTDFTDKFTLSIDRVNMAKISEDSNLLMDDAFSFETNDDGTFSIYMHVPDVDYYFKKDTEADMFMRGIGETIYAKNYKTSMIPKEFAKENLSLIRGKVRPCITIKYIVNQTGEIQDVSFYKSYVNVNYNLTARNATIFMKDNSDAKLYILNDMYTVAKAMRSKRGEKVGNRSKGNVIMDEFNIGGDLATAKYFSEKGIVFPYKNYFGKRSERSREHIAKIEQFVNDNDLNDECKAIIYSVLDSFNRVFYSTTKYGNHSFKGMYAGNVGNPMREYISLETLRLIKDLVIDQKFNYLYWKKRIERDCIEYTETTARIKTLYGSK